MNQYSAMFFSDKYRVYQKFQTEFWKTKTNFESLMTIFKVIDIYVANLVIT